MNYYLVLTTACNLHCKYCEGHADEDFMSEEEMENYDLNLPIELSFDISRLKKLAERDKSMRLTFYGGEPLLRRKLIMEIMDELPNVTFMLQTNGIFLDKLATEYVNRFKTILVSIDGDKEVTNMNRGKGVYEKIVRNLKYIKENGFSGEIIARMVAFDGADIYRNVRYLIENKDFPFTSVHWQIDAQFWSSDYEKRDFKSWSVFYNKGIEKLINYWIEDMKINNRVLKIYPFVGIVHDLLHNIKSPMRCGAGHSLFGIQTDGTIVACPITAGYKPLYSGTVSDSNVPDSIKKIEPGEPCSSCEIKDICGGRCLYANYTKYWGEKGFREVCDTIFFLVYYLKYKLDEIKSLIKKGVVRLEDFDFDRYNGCEIIP